MLLLYMGFRHIPILSPSPRGNPPGFTSSSEGTADKLALKTTTLRHIWFCCGYMGKYLYVIVKVNESFYVLVQ